MITETFAQLVQSPLYQKEFLFCQTNRKRFLPWHTADDQAFFHGIHQQRYRSGQELVRPKKEVLERVTVHGTEAFEAIDGPVLFCPFHFGPFMLIGPYLESIGLPLAVLTEENIQAQQLHQEADPNLPMVYANSPSSMLEMLEYLQQGRNLIAFLDGGQGLNTKRESFATIQFLNHPFYVRKGIFHLAYATQTPIVPVVTYWKDDHIHICFGTAIRPQPTQHRAAFITDTAQQCFDWFHSYLVEDPEQFTLWHNIHWYTDSPNVPLPVSIENEELVSFDTRRFQLFSSESVHYLFDEWRYDCYPIPEILSRWLTQLMHRKAEPLERLKACVKPTLLSSLLERGILIHSHSLAS